MFHFVLVQYIDEYPVGSRWSPGATTALAICVLLRIGVINDTIGCEGLNKPNSTTVVDNYLVPR